MAWNCLSHFWMSLVVESTVLPVQHVNESLLDWTITAQPVLTLKNLLQIPSQFEIQEKSRTEFFGDEVITREQGLCGPNETLQIHTVDTRKEIGLIFTPEGYHFKEQNSVTLSFGFSQYSAGVEGPQRLPDSFRVDSVNGNEAWIMIHRVIDSGDLNSSYQDPGAAVALGVRMDCQLYVPLWIINRTLVPVEAVLCAFRQSKSELKLPFGSEESQELGSKPQEDSDLKVVDTGPEKEHVGHSFANRTLIAAHSAGFLSYTASEDLQVGVRLKVEGSGPAPTLALSPQKVSKTAGRRRLIRPVESGFLNVKKLLINAAVPIPDNKLYRLIATLEASGKILQSCFYRMMYFYKIDCFYRYWFHQE